jgi:hypothetical protein
MVKFLMAILLCVGMAHSATADVKRFSQYFPTSGESPFPWGAESPFPWSTVDGLWKTKTADLYFKFDIIRGDSSSKYLRVILLNQKNVVLGEGVGVLRKDDIIRARVIGHYVDAYALVRAYNKRSMGRSCSGKDCVLVVTLRESTQVQGKDLHYLLQKIR